MKVTYLHQYFATRESAGGTRSFEFARRLTANGHQVKVITSSAFLPPRYVPAGSKGIFDIEGIATTVFRLSYSNKMSYAERIKAFLQFAALASMEAMRSQADVVFATSTPLSIAIPGLAARTWRRVPMVFEVRDLWPDLPIAVGALKNPVAVHAARALEWTAYHTASQIVALSPGMADGVIRRGILPQRVTVIPNSCDVDVFDVPAWRGDEIRRRLPGLRPGQPLIVYAGTFGRINGVGYLVEVARATRELDRGVRFLLVGTGAERDSIIQQARDYGVLDDNLWVWDPLPKSEMPALLAAATVATSVFLPIEAMWNNSANKFFDALAAGKPVAINYGGWQAELLRETGVGLVLPPHEPRAAAKLLVEFVNDKRRLEQAAAASRHLAHTRFSRDDMARKLEEVLWRAVQGN